MPATTNASATAICRSSRTGGSYRPPITSAATNSIARSATPSDSSWSYISYPRPLAIRTRSTGLARR